MFDFFKRNKSERNNTNAMLQKAMSRPDYPDRLREVAQKTMELNTEELPHVEELIKQLEECKSIWEYPTLMHNVVLLGRAKRNEMIPFLNTLLVSVKKEIQSCNDDEVKNNYKFVVDTFKRVKKEDTHPHVVYYDLSMFLTSFYAYLVKLSRSANDNESKTLASLHKCMISIMRRTKTEKEVAIEKCKQIIKDLTPKSELGETK